MEQEVNYQKEIRMAIDIVALNTKAMEQVAKDESKTNIAYGIIVISALLNWMGTYLYTKYALPSVAKAFYTTSIVNSAVQIVVQIGMAIASIYLLSYVAKNIFNGKANHDAFFRAAAYGSIIMWIGIFQSIAGLAGIWSLVVSFTVLRKIHHLDNTQAFLSIVISAVTFAILFFIIGSLGAFSMPFLIQ